MARQGRSTTEGRVERVKVQVDRWRSKRKRCSPMPERLWNEATQLARELGVHRIKCELGLNYVELAGEGDERFLSAVQIIRPR